MKYLFLAFLDFIFIFSHILAWIYLINILGFLLSFIIFLRNYSPKSPVFTYKPLMVDLILSDSNYNTLFRISNFLKRINLNNESIITDYNFNRRNIWIYFNERQSYSLLYKIAFVIFIISFDLIFILGSILTEFIF